MHNIQDGSIDMHFQALTDTKCILFTMKFALKYPSEASPNALA
jgi:hypothetical protein